MLNAINRDIPSDILDKLKTKPFQGPFSCTGERTRAQVNYKIVWPGTEKLVKTLREALEKVGFRNGMTISFHHHLRNGDYVLNTVLQEIAAMGFKEITLVASGIFECHEPLIEHIKNGVVTGLQSNYMVGPVAKAVSQGIFDQPVIMRSHGGRDRAVESGELKIDVAFIAAPTADTYGNIDGTEGPSACGSLGYAYSDARYADKVIAVTDNLVPYPVERISIDQTLVDYVVKIDCIGDPKGIVSGTTKITRNPVGLKITEQAARAIEVGGYLKDGFSFQTGAGGLSLAVASFIRERMRNNGIVGSFGLGGITELFVEMLQEGLFKVLLDTQCFDLKSVQSLRENKKHLEISSGMYSNPFTKGAVVNNLDVVVLGATEIDVDFNVNVTTGMDGCIMGGSGGHCDAAAGSKLTVIVTNLMRARMPVVVDRVTTVNTPGENIGVLVTEYGIAVNPKYEDLKKKLIDQKLPVLEISDLKKIAYGICGAPAMLKAKDRNIAVVEYRDGTIIDVIPQFE